MPIFYTKNMNKLYTKEPARRIFLKKAKKLVGNAALFFEKRGAKATENAKYG